MKNENKILSFWKKRKWIVIAAAAVIIPTGKVSASRIKTATQPPEKKYEISAVRKTTVIKTVSASGKIASETTVTLKFQTSGMLTWVGVKKGDQVKKWQAIASLDKKEIESTLKKKLLAYMNERWDFEGTQDTYDINGRKIGTVPNLTEAEKRILEKAQFDLDSTVLDVEIQDLAKKYATLYSPVNGIVTEVESPIAGVNITPTTATFTIADPTQMKFTANVDEVDVGQIRLGQKVGITIDAYPEEEFIGEVAKIAFASVSTSGGGTAFPVDIKLSANLEEKFKIGMNGDAEIVVAEKDNVLTIPVEAVVEKNGSKTVRTLENKKITEVPVKTGLESDAIVEIVEGLGENQQIIVADKKP